MKRLLLAAAVAASAFTVAPASAAGCPPLTQPATLPTGQGYCTPFGTVHCDPGPCRFPVEVHCPTDIPVWTHYCTQIFGWD